MANANAVKIRSTKKKSNGKPKYPKPSGANLAHNSAVNKATYWLNDGDKIIQSQSYETTHQVNADWNKWENEAKERYAKNPNNQRNIKSNAVLLEEGLIIIGTDVKATENDLANIAKEFVEKFEKDNNTKVRHWAFHNHEGHIEEDGTEKINRHIHFIFDNVNNDGTMVRRNWKREYFKQLQTDIFDISKKYCKDIERAKESEYEQVEIDDRIVNVNTKKQIHHRVFRDMKKNEQIENLNTKFTDMMKERNEVKKENSTLKGQVTKTKNENKQLKEELEKQLKELNTQLQSQLSNREQHAQREALVRELKEEIKNKTLTVDSMKTKFSELEEKLLKQKEHLESVIEVKEIDILDLNNQNKELQAQKEVLASKVTTLQEKIVSKPIMSEREVINELQSIVNDEIIEKDIKNGLIGTEKGLVLKEPKSFLKKVQDIAIKGTQSIIQKYEELKNKYNDLVEVLRSKDKEIATLKEKVRALESEAPKQIKEKELSFQEKLEKIKEEHLPKETKQLNKLVKELENTEVGTVESDSSILNEKEVEEEEIKGKVRRDR